MSGVLPLLTGIRGKALDLLFPRKCVGCGGAGSFLCVTCRASLPWTVTPLCPRCQRPRPGGSLCADCQGQAALDGALVAFRFEGIIRQAVYHLKYRNLRALSPPLGELLADFLRDTGIPGDVLVPVPLHPKRLRERGYNQTGLLADELSRLTGIEVGQGCLTRRTMAMSQAMTTSIAGRRENVAAAFGCIDDRLRGRRVLLMDDVTTSGATLEAAAAALRQIGVKSVWGLALAREI